MVAPLLQCLPLLLCHLLLVQYIACKHQMSSSLSSSTRTMFVSCTPCFQPVSPVLFFVKLPSSCLIPPWYQPSCQVETAHLGSWSCCNCYATSLKPWADPSSVSYSYLSIPPHKCRNPNISHFRSGTCASVALNLSHDIIDSG